MWNDAIYWEMEWQAERRESIYGRRQKDMDDFEWWNQRAPSFAANSEGNVKSNENKELLESIIQSGFIDKNAELLDIGCGPGNYSLPLASMFKKVIAVDPSSKMLSILEERAAAQNITNIETVCMPWEDVDLDELKWKNRFGLVMAIKTPGIKNTETLKKMINASNKGCYFNGFCIREDKAQQDIWRLLFKEEQPPVSADAFYVFHLLHSFGYLPTLNLNRAKYKREMKLDEAVDNLILMMKPYSDDLDMLRKLIEEYARNNAAGNEFVRVRNFILGNITWDVTRKDTDLC